MIHERTHPTLDVAGCFLCRVSSVRVGASAMPTRKADVVHKAGWASQMDRDMHAYKTMRQQGIQPQGLTGAHERSLANEEHEVTGVPKLWKDRDEYLVGGVAEKWSDVQEKAST